MTASTTSPDDSLALRYREAAAPAGLADVVACVWRHDAGDAGHVHRVVPDGCVDLIWRAGRELVVAGPATGAVLAELPRGSTTLGVRFRPGAGDAFLGLPLSELRDCDPGLEELWSADGRRRDAARRLTEELAGAGSPGDRLRLLANAVRTGRRASPSGADPLVAAAVARIGAAGSTGDELRVAALGAELGLSERQLLRRFRASVGYGPKTLARVLRFQRFLAAAWAGSAGGAASSLGAMGEAPLALDRTHPPLARLALDAGYADQAHLTRECTALAGVPPSRLIGA